MALRRFCVYLFFPFLLLSQPGFSAEVMATEVIAAVAANFRAPMQDIAAAFEQSSGHKVKVVVGGSGKLFAQIRHGAPFDVFFSADQQKPKALIKTGNAVADSRFSYAQGRLALWSYRSPATTEQKNKPREQKNKPRNISQQLQQRLHSGGFNKLALANAKLAPYGRAAKETLRALKLEKSSRSKWIQGENIGQTFAFVRSGSAQLGFVALSQLIDIDKKHYWLVPTHYHQPINQDAVLLKRAQYNPAAKALLNFIRSPQARAIIERYGYVIHQPQGLNTIHPEQP